MNKVIKKVLERLENNGYEAYLIGGYVRDLLVGKESFDIDICTNATQKELIKIFPNASSKNMGGIDFKIKEFNFEITTYREEKKYKNRKPIEYNYVGNLLVDLQRRDFTINSICMNKKGELIDLLNGTKDLQDCKIKMIGDINTKIEEDPLRILRGIRIATKLNFTIDKNLYKKMKSDHKLILSLSKTRIKEELDKILLSNNVKKGLKLLEDLNINKDLGLSNYENIIPVKNLEGMYAQLTINYELPFTKVEKTNITNIKKILASKEITPKIVYEYGLYLCQIVADIKGIDKKQINKIEKELAIHDKSEINIKAEYLIKEFNISGNKISKLLQKIEEALINSELKNKKNDIIKYVRTIINDI